MICPKAGFRLSHSFYHIHICHLSWLPNLTLAQICRPVPSSNWWLYIFTNMKLNSCVFMKSAYLELNSSFPKYALPAQAAQWIERRSANQRVAVWFPIRAHAWVAGQVPSRGRARGSHTLMFLFSLPFSLLFPPSKNKKSFLKKVTNMLFFLCSLSWLIIWSPTQKSSKSSISFLLCTSNWPKTLKYFAQMTAVPS